MRVLMVTSEWPTPEALTLVPFIVQQVAYLRKAGVEVEVFSFRGEMNPFNYFKAWLQLRKQYEIDRFDLIHAQFGQSGLLALPMSVPLVVTYHGSDLQGFVGPDGGYTWQGKVLQQVSRFVAKRASAVILVSEHLAHYLPSQKPYHVIPCGVDFELFRPLARPEARQRLNLPPEKVLLLFGAHPDNPIKRYKLAQQAVRRIEPMFDVDLVPLVGVRHDEVPLFMNACDVLLFTSEHEGSPTVVKEALACNLPIVSVDVGDVRRRIAHIEGCVLCEEDTPQALADGLAQVLRSPHERTQSRESIKDLDERRVIQNVVKVYQAALASD